MIPGCRHLYSAGPDVVRSAFDDVETDTGVACFRVTIVIVDRTCLFYVPPVALFDRRASLWYSWYGAPIGVPELQVRVDEGPVASVFACHVDLISLPGNQLNPEVVLLVEVR